MVYDFLLPTCGQNSFPIAPRNDPYLMSQVHQLPDSGPNQKGHIFDVTRVRSNSVDCKFSQVCKTPFVHYNSIIIIKCL